jgi:hypothetical protein
MYVMKRPSEIQILSAVRKRDPKKKRVTFFISKMSKYGLATWCQEKGVTESGTIEEMIRAVVPSRYFKEKT